MPISDPLYRFSSIIVQGAPDNPGVYALWNGSELILLGRGSSIRERLLAHLGKSSVCIRDATHYSWELSLRPEAREAELLERFRARHGRLPRCNEQAA